MKQQMCNKHGLELYHMVKRKGMGHRITESQSEMVAIRDRWLAGTTPHGEFDPLIVATLEIFNKANEMFGFRWPFEHECPLCAAVKILERPDVADAWIDNITDLQLAVCLKNGLMQRAPEKKIIVT